MISAALKNNAAIEQINEQIITLNAANKHDNFKGRTWTPCFSDCEYKGATAKMLGFFERMHKANRGGVIEVKHATIAKELKFSTKTSQRSASQLEKDGRLIVLRYWKNAYIYIPPDKDIADIKSQIEAIVQEAISDESWGQNVSKMGTKCLQDTLIYKERLLESSQEPKPDQPTKSPPPKPKKPKPKNQPTAKLFYNNQIKKMGELVSSIKNSCDKINDMAKKHNNKFNAYQFVGSALKSKENYNIRAIAGVLYDVVNYNYDYIFEDGFGVWGYLSKSVKMRSGEYNGYDAKAFNDMLKKHESDFCEILRRECIEF